MVRKTKKFNRKNYNYNYHRRGGTINIIIRDGNKVIDKFVCNLDDKQLCKRVFSTIMHKYDFFNPEINHIKGEEKDWLSMDNPFFS